MHCIVSLRSRADGCILIVSHELTVDAGARALNGLVSVHHTLRAPNEVVYAQDAHPIHTADMMRMGLAYPSCHGVSDYLSGEHSRQISTLDCFVHPVRSGHTWPGYCSVIGVHRNNSFR